MSIKPTSHNGASWRNPEINARMVAEAGKLGERIPSHNGERSEMLRARADARRIIGKLSERHTELSNKNDSDGATYVLSAMDGFGSIIASISATLDMMDAESSAPTASASAGSDGWKSSEGKALRVMRNAADYRAAYTSVANGGKAAAYEGDDVSLTDFVRGAAGMKTTQAVRNALSIGTDTAGGFSVPSLVMPGILEALAPASSVLSAGAPIVLLEEGAKSYTTAVLAAIPTAAWRSENGALAESEPTFRGVPATPRSLSFIFKVSRELLMDSPNMEQALTIAIAQSFARELDRVALRGTGTAPEPRGLLNTVGVNPVSNGANGTALASYANFFAATQAILNANAPMPTAAIMAPRSLVKLGGLTATDGQPLNVPPMLQPVRMLNTSQVPVNLTVGTSNDCSEIYVGDFTRMAFMMRESMSIQPLNEKYADNGQIGFACHVRADVSVFYPAAFAIVTGVRP